MTPPSGMTEVLETLEGNAAQLLLETAEVLLPTASSTSTRTGTASVASSNAAAVIALAPAITSSVSVKHNQMAPGDVVYMEANGFVEFMSVASGPTGTGPYSYTMNRNLDGTGQNTWYAGDAIFNTGVAGNGFIDLFSLSGVNGRFLNYIYSYDNGAATTPFESGTYGSNVALEHDYQYLPSSLAANDAMYFGATTRWNNLYLYLTTIASWNIATVWEYWDGVAWVTFSPTITGAFTTLGSVNIEWAETALTSWAPKQSMGRRPIGCVIA